MTHEDLIELGFRIYGIKDNNPFYQIHFKHPYNFGVSDISGELKDGEFEVYGNKKKYIVKEELQRVIDIFGPEFYDLGGLDSI